MGRMRAASAGLALAVAFVVTGCSTPAEETIPTPSPRGTSGSTTPPPSPSPSPSPSGSPTTAPTTAAPPAWTESELSEACIDFQSGWAEDEGYSPDDFAWSSPAPTQQSGGVSYVFLQGTFTTPDGAAVAAEFSCAVSGTPQAPVVTEVQSE